VNDKIFLNRFKKSFAFDWGKKAFAFDWGKKAFAFDREKSICF